MHQMKIIKTNFVSIMNHFVTESPFFTRSLVLCIFILMAAALWMNPRKKRKKFLYAWVIATFSIYCSGFLLLIARSPRRFYALMIVFLLLSFHFLEELRYGLKDIISDQRKKALVFSLFMIIAGAFALKPCVNVLKSVKHIITIDQVNPYREMAEQINTIKFPGPYAIVRSSQKPTTDYYMTYFLKKQLLGRPLSQDVQGITEELKSAGGRSLLVFDNPEMSERLRSDGRYVHRGSIPLGNNKKYEHAIGWVITKHEVITGWDEAVDVFTLN